MTISTTSFAEKPDLDWSQVRETVRMFRIGVSAIEYSMSTGDESISSLIDAFTNMNKYMREIKAIARSVEGDEAGAHSEQYEEMLVQLDNKCDRVIHDLKSAVISFQFYDRLTQQLSHISTSLEDTANLVNDQQRLFNPHEWKELQAQVYKSFTMQEGKILFDALLRGACKDEAIAEARKYGNREANELELF